MGDAYIFDTDAVQSQDGGNGGQCARFIGNVDLDGEYLFDGAAGGFDKGIPVAAGTVKKAIDLCFGTFIDLLPDCLQSINISSQKRGYIFPVGQAYLLPHVGRRRSDTGNVLKASGGNHFHNPFF